MRTARLLYLGGLAVTACAVTPISRHIAIGHDAYVILVGDDRAGEADLYAVSAAGGPVYQLTFTRAAESSPSLGPGGSVLVFLRQALDESPRHVVFLNLRTGSEREAVLPAALGNPERVVWRPNGGGAYIRTTTGVVVVDAPPNPAMPRPLAPAERAAADSALALFVGRPAVARVVDCEAGDEFSETGRTLCTEAPDGIHHRLDSGVTEPFVWGGDSVAWFSGSAIEVRPLAGGRLRQLTWSDPPNRPRQATFFSP